jgi:hypothetical protein
MPSRELHDASVLMVQNVAAEPPEAATEDCAEFDVGPVIDELRRARRAHDAWRSLVPVGLGGVRRN